MATREPIYQALFNLVVNDSRVQGAFVTTGRYLQHNADVTPDQCPALYMFQKPETRVQAGKGLPAKRTLHCVLVMYVADAEAATQIPATLCNTLCDVVDDVINMPANGSYLQNLGGLVEHVYLEPQLGTYEGLLGDKSIIVAEISMLIP